MTAPDGPPAELQNIIIRLANTVRDTINEAWFHGLKDGMEVGAQISAETGVKLVELGHTALSPVAESIADTIRLAALQAERPTP